METFKDLKINPKLEEKLHKRGIKVPTPIQREAIPVILEGKDMIGRASTGSGKTLAFLLPLFQMMKPGVREVQTLIITPTRELAIQISSEAEKLNEGLEILLAYGGRDAGAQIAKAKGSQLVVATPGRLLDLLKRGELSLRKIKTLVLDEADQMLHMGFKNEVEEIIKHCAKRMQVLCFSATMDTEVKKLAYRYTKEAVVVDVVSEEKRSIKEYLVETSDRWKIDALCEVLNDTNPFMGIIFCRTKARVDRLEKRLYEKGYNCQKIHSDIPQSKREKIMKAFRNAEIQYLVATDVAARGLHIEGVTHVYNYDIPEETESYTHRTGRTGRAGDEGETYLFVTPKGESELDRIRTLDYVTLVPREIRGERDVMSTNPETAGKYNKRINASPKKFARDKKDRRR